MTGGAIAMGRWPGLQATSGSEPAGDASGPKRDATRASSSRTTRPSTLTGAATVSSAWSRPAPQAARPAPQAVESPRHPKPSNLVGPAPQPLASSFRATLRPECASPPFDPREDSTTAQLHRLLAKKVAQLPAPFADLCRGLGAQDALQARGLAQDFAERCLLSLAIWRRFGTAEFAEQFGTVERTDEVSIFHLPRHAVDAAVAAWKSGRHAVAETSAAQACARRAEMRAWEFGSVDAGALGAQDFREQELALPLARGRKPTAAQRDGEAARLRAMRATAAGEAIVRPAYARLLGARHHPILELWRKRGLITDALFGPGGLPAIRAALAQVTGYKGADPDGQRANWTLALDLVTMLPTADGTGPSVHHVAYGAWLRRRRYDAHYADSY